MFRTLRDAFKVEDLRKKIFYTLIMLVVIRVGASIPIPGVDSAQLQAQFASSDLDMLGMLDAFSGGAFKNMTLFALGIIPYINSSIIMNLLTIAIPALEEIQKEGEDGRKKIATITRYGTVVLAFIQATAICIGLRSIFVSFNFFSVAIAVLAMTAGTAFLMWIGERITENGIGNGISLIITINILSRLPGGMNLLRTLAQTNRWIAIIGVIVVFLAVTVVIVLIQLGERRIPVQYAKRVQGRKSYGGASTYIPLKVNAAGVIPVIFAASLLQFPSIITNFFNTSPTGLWGTLLNYLNYYNVKGNYGIGAIIYFVLIIAFAYFYTAIIFNPYDVANNLKKNGGFVMGIRSGKPTVEYLTNVLNKLVFIGGLILGLIAIAPIVLSAIANVSINFGGTSLIIVVGVTLETVKQVESQLVMRHYKGFLNA